MKAFRNDKAVKEKYLARVKNHAEADEIVKGIYWENGKGCAIGCTVHSDNHNAFETELGIPEWIARCSDTLFEGMSNERSKKWPIEFLKAIPVGVCLEEIKVPFLIYILESSLDSMRKCEYDKEKWPDVDSAIKESKLVVNQMITALKSGDKKTISAARSAARSAESAARSAASAAWGAAWGAARSAESAARSAESAAWGAESAESAARSAESAARSAESAAWSAARSAESAAYEKFADKLLELVVGCK